MTTVATAFDEPPVGVLREQWTKFKQTPFYVEVVAPLKGMADSVAPFVTIGSAVLTAIQLAEINSKLDEINAKLDRIAVDVAEILRLVRELPGIQQDQLDQIERRRIFNQIRAHRRTVLETILPQFDKSGKGFRPKNLPPEVKTEIKGHMKKINEALFELDGWSMPSDGRRASHLGIAYTNAAMTYGYQSSLLLSRLAGGDVEREVLLRGAISANLERNRNVIRKTRHALFSERQAAFLPIDGIPPIFRLADIAPPWGPPEIGNWVYIFLERSGSAADGYTFTTVLLPAADASKYEANKKYYDSPIGPRILPHLYDMRERNAGYAVYHNEWRARSAARIKVINDAISGEAARVHGVYDPGLATLDDIEVATAAQISQCLVNPDVIRHLEAPLLSDGATD